MMFVIYFLSFFLTSLLGYWIHRSFHRRWSGKPYRAHLNHHLQKYPPSNFLSNTYRDAGADNTAHLFWIASIPIVGILIVLFLLHIISFALILAVALGIGTAGFLHDYFHDQIHISPSYWEKYQWFLRMREIHRIHHRNLNKNFGILLFFWDHLFGTFTEKKKK